MNFHVARFCFVVALAMGGGVRAAAAESAPDVFGQHCASCHGPDGKARTPIGKKLRVKDLTLSEVDDSVVAARIREGVRDERGIQKMPGFKEKLSAEEIAALVAYVKTLRQR